MTTLEQDAAEERTAPPGAGPADRPQGSTFETLAVCAFIFGLLSLFIAIFAVGLAGRAVTEARDGGGGGGGGGDAGAGAPTGPATREVVMREFAFDPDEVVVDAGSVLTLVNEGQVVHNLSFDGTASDMVGAGETGELDLAGVTPGTYEMRCDVPGHADAGMVGTITVR